MIIDRLSLHTAMPMRLGGLEHVFLLFLLMARNILQAVISINYDR